MSFHCARRFPVCTLLSLISSVTITSVAEAQLQQGTTFNAIFNVGGPGVRDDATMPGTRGSVGCGDACGDDLTSVLNSRPDERHALATRHGNMKPAVITRSARAAKQAPPLFARANEQAAQPKQLTLASLLQDGLSTGDETFGVGGLGLFLSGRYVRLDADTTTRELGSTTNGGGFSLGADCRFGSSFVLGGAFGFNHYSAEFSAKAGSSKVDDYAGILFGSLFLDDVVYIDGTLRGSFLTTDTLKRTPALDGGPIFGPQKSDPDGWTISGDLGTGAELPFGALALNPYVRLGVYHTRIEAHTARGGDGLVGFLALTTHTATIGFRKEL